MKFQFEPAEQSCFVTETTCSSSMRCEIPVAPKTLLKGLKHLLLNANERDHTIGGVMFDRMRDGIRVNVGSFSYTFKYVHLFPVVMETAQ
ncbi:MAG: hypothetical protein ABJ251_07015 [Paracoccaceae bacterium]